MNFSTLENAKIYANKVFKSYLSVELKRNWVKDGTSDKRWILEGSHDPWIMIERLKLDDGLS